MGAGLGGVARIALNLFASVRVDDTFFIWAEFVGHCEPLGGEKKKPPCEVQISQDGSKALLVRLFG